MQAADAVGPLSDALGVHYRGTDKQTADWDTNPVTQDDMIAIVSYFMRKRPDLKKVLLATDDRTFPDRLNGSVPTEVINLGNIPFHKDENVQSRDLAQAKRARLDSVLLSRCGAVVKTSSALSGFAKVFNPGLDIYRCAASKKFADIPYFPVAYIPAYESDDPKVRATLDRLMRDDRQQSETLPPQPFSARQRSWRRSIMWRTVEALTGSPVR